MISSLKLLSIFAIFRLGSSFVHINRHIAYANAYNDWNKFASTDTNGNPLTPLDTIRVNYDEGRVPTLLFDEYIEKMSKIFQKHNASLNYVNIGACDGENDRTQLMFWADANINGLFIEPLEANVNDFQVKINSHAGASIRTDLIRAAVNETCPAKLLEFERPKVVDGPDDHWKRREIGRIKKDRFDPSWKTDFVRCLTFEEVMREWHDLRRKRNMHSLELRMSQHRPHAIKIDTEGNDHAIIRSILRYPPRVLPIMILYEIKTFSSREIDEVRELLGKHGYSTNKNLLRTDGTFYFDDVIAILRKP